MKEVNICITSDDNYAKHMYITIFSALYNLNKNYCGIIWIFDSWLSSSNKILLKSLEKKFENSSINFVSVDENKYKRLPDFHWTWQTYFRIDAPSLLKCLDKVLYLDPDIIVDWDISELYNIWLGDKYAIWAPTNGYTYFQYEHQLHLPIKKCGWFCAWVMLMNLKYMRNNSITEKIFDYMQTHKIINDQDAITAILYDKRKDISVKYSVDPYAYTRYYKVFKNNLEDPIIIHYAAWKPWEKYCPNPLAYKYHEYRELSGLPPCEFSKNLDLKLRLKRMFIPLLTYIIVLYQGINDRIHWKKIIL